mmetsp:Transcript_16799/g.27229  ORF Transcript_16799/g.27229 Transcript_16799/m.27229 type:complete len:87 (+) Transcript_16799:1610-1870(+)
MSVQLNASFDQVVDVGSIDFRIGVLLRKALPVVADVVPSEVIDEDEENMRFVCVCSKCECGYCRECWYAHCSFVFVLVDFWGVCVC